MPRRRCRRDSHRIRVASWRGREREQYLLQRASRCFYCIVQIARSVVPDLVGSRVSSDAGANILDGPLDVVIKLKPTHDVMYREDC